MEFYVKKYSFKLRNNNCIYSSDNAFEISCIVHLKYKLKDYNSENKEDSHWVENINLLENEKIVSKVASEDWVLAD